MRKMAFITLLLLNSLLCSCVLPGQNAYINDPFTGGVDASRSSLLNIPMPVGLQYYPSHSKISGGARKEGLEVWRGYVDLNYIGQNVYANMKQENWQIRMMEKAGSRAIYVYEKENELACIVFYPQAALTIMQIWAGPRLADGVLPEAANDPDVDGVNSMPAEEYEPITDAPVKKAPENRTETWGVEEKDL